MYNERFTMVSGRLNATKNLKQTNQNVKIEKSWHLTDLERIDIYLARHHRICKKEAILTIFNYVCSFSISDLEMMSTWHLSWSSENWCNSCCESDEASEIGGHRGWLSQGEELRNSTGSQECSNGDGRLTSWERDEVVSLGWKWGDIYIFEE